MKKILTLGFLLSFFYHANIHAQNLENNSFEQWEPTVVNNVVLFEEPSGYWTTNNLVSTLSADTNPFVTIETEKVVEGTKAVRITSDKWTALPIGGLCAVGEFQINFADQVKSYRPGMPFTARPDRLTGNFIYQPVDIVDANGNIVKDACEIYTYLTKFSNGKTDTVGVAYFSTENTVNDYQYLSIPFEYYSTATPDTMFTVFAASKAAAPPLYLAGVGTTLIVDNFNFEYQVGISAPIVPLYAVNIYPNPTQNILHVAIDAPQILSIYIFNIEGKLVNLSTLSDKKNTINIQNLQTGTYIYQIKDHENIVAGGQFQVH